MAQTALPSIQLWPFMNGNTTTLVMIPPLNMQSSFWFVYIHGTYFVLQNNSRAVHMPNLISPLFAQLTAMLYEFDQCVQSFSALRNWATPVKAPNPYRIVIQSGHRSASKQVSWCNGPHATKVAAIIPGAEDGLFGRQDIVIRRRGELKANGANHFDKILVTHRSYDPLSYFLLLPHGTDGWHLRLQLQCTFLWRR